MNLKMIINSYGAQIALFGFCMFNLYRGSKNKKKLQENNERLKEISFNLRKEPLSSMSIDDLKDIINLNVQAKILIYKELIESIQKKVMSLTDQHNLLQKKLIYKKKQKDL